MTRYIIDISSIYSVDETTASKLKSRPDDLNKKWLIDQVNAGFITICDVIEEEEPESHDSSGEKLFKCAECGLKYPESQAAKDDVRLCEFCGEGEGADL